MNNEQKYKEALEKIAEWAAGNRSAMDDSFSWEFTCNIENMAREALGLPKKSWQEFNDECN